MATDFKAAWRTWRTYRGTGALTQAFLAARMAVAPLGPLEPELRALRGRVLSLGCGHGAVDRYIAEINPDVTIDGVDLDRARVEIARATADRSPRFTARVADVRNLQAGATYDAALCIDVLHHVPYEEHEQIARALGSTLREGGTCLIKEMATTPRRQYRWNQFHDRVVTGSGEIYCRAPNELADVFASTGFDIVQVRRLRRLGIYPQYLVACRKQAAG